MAKVTTTLDSVDIQRVKWAQQLTNKASSNKRQIFFFYLHLFSETDNPILMVSVSLQYLYSDLACKERAHFTPESETPVLDHARRMKVIYSEASPLFPHFILTFTQGSFLFLIQDTVVTTLDSR